MIRAASRIRIVSGASKLLRPQQQARAQALPYGVCSSVYARSFWGGSSSNNDNSSSSNDSIITETTINTIEPPPDTPSSPLSSVDATLDKLFESQEASNVVADAIAAGTFSPTWYNVADQAINWINFVRDSGDLPYGAAIVVATGTLRLAIFPLFVKLQQNSARMAHMQPEMHALKTKLESLGSTTSQETKMKYGLQMRALFKKYKCNPFTAIIPPLVQIPIFMGMFFGLRKMPDYYGSLLSAEGFLWFPDLTVCDPYYILPIAAGFTTFLSIELNKDQMMATNPAQGKLLLNVFRTMSVVMVPMVASFPASLNLYWVVNNSATALQMLLFKQMPVRKFFDIWDMPKPVPGMPQAKSIMDTVQDTLKPKLSEEQQIKNHNKSIENKQKLHGGGGGASGNRRRSQKKR